MNIPTYTSLKSDSDIGLTIAEVIYGAQLAASTDTAIVIPDNHPYYKALIKASPLPSATLFYSLNAPASAPSGSAFTLGNSEIIHEYDNLIREVKAGDVLHFFTPASNVYVTISLYKYR